MRGLKLSDYHPVHQINKVASFTDAWIETVILVVNIGGCEVASFTDAWIETSGTTTTPASPTVASFTDAWIET